MQKFQVIVADPPWSFSDSLNMSDVARSAKANYNTMTIGQIKDLKVKEITSPDGAILALWVPSSLLQEGLDVMKAWGFKHKQTYIWVKTKKQPFLILLKSKFQFKLISIQVGFISSIKFTFQSLFHFFNCFSRFEASKPFSHSSK